MRDRIVGTLSLIVLTALLAGCVSWRGSDGENSGPQPPPTQVTVQPGDKAKDVNPGLPSLVRVTGGFLQQAALTNHSGNAVTAALSPDRRSWQNTEPLDYDETYTWSGTVVGPDRTPRPFTSSFTTVAPARQVDGTLNIKDGDTVGVAAPIILQFDHQVSDRAAVERALKVQASVPTEGSWAWLPDDDNGSRVHYRPRNYWQPGTKVTVTAELYGLPYGKGSHGSADVSTHFTIGRAQIVKADVNSHRMIVIRDGRPVLDLPASYGLGSDPNRHTTNGIHVVMSKSETVLMTNPAYGYFDVPEHWAVRISNNGEFIHANPATTGVQGSSNVTHGCVNLSTKNARQYFDTAIFGDPVEVTNSPTPMTADHGDIYDWTVPWDIWKAMSALATA